MTGVSMLDPMDDLFGEAADGLGVNVAMPAPPLTAPLLSCINDMQRTGSCSRLAWSNSGNIAHISKHGRHVDLHCVLRDPRSGDWKLSPASKHIITAPEGVKFVHLAFNRAGNELAVVDSVNGLHMYSAGSMLGHMLPAPTDASINDPSRTSLDAAVGVYWLPTYQIDFRAPFITPATKVGDHWLTSMHMSNTNLPRVHNALEGRNALMHVSATSKLTLLFQNELGVWHALHSVLEEWHTSKDILTHAAIGMEGDHLILVTHDHARRFRVYKIVINWNAVQQNPNGGVVTIAPTVDVSHLSMLGPERPELAQLTSLHILSAAAPHADPSASATTTVAAIYTHVPTAMGAVQQNDYFSMLVRWDIETVTPTLHGSFAKLKQNGPTTNTRPVTVLRRQPDILLSKIILNLQTLHHNTAIALISSLGTIDLYDRATWTPIEHLGDTTTASTLQQSGLGFSSSEHSANIAGNADCCMLACTRPDGKVETKNVSLRFGWQPIEDGITDTKGMVETAIVCLARQYTQLISMTASTDEVMAVLPRDLSKDSKVLFVRQIIKILVRVLDVSMVDQQRQQQAVLKEAMHLRALSAQLVLNETIPEVQSGADHARPRREFAAQYAYVYLHMRQNALTLMTTFAPKEKELLARQPDLVPSLTGLLKWYTNLLIYFTETFRQVNHLVTQSNGTRTATSVFQTLIHDKGNPSLILFLSSFPRVLLNMQTRVAPTFVKWVTLAHARGRLMEHKLQMEDFLHLVETMPFKYPAFIELIVEVDGAVRAAYMESGASAERRVECEIEMITQGVIPPELRPAVEQMVQKIFPKFCRGVDMGRVYFWDTEWLGIEYALPDQRKSGGGGEGGGEGLGFDALRKTPLRKGMGLRQCRKCGSKMEDLDVEGKVFWPDWLRNSQRHCFCQDSWWGGQC
ncbi:Mediator of RNA polymerase II transcription subunit 16 [Recurvomyces mirabilis]|nr:Mediator of RNA polymerase II transcription subunit 16 [Recurvomyces mirabilis]